MIIYKPIILQIISLIILLIYFFHASLKRSDILKKVSLFSTLLLVLYFIFLSRNYYEVTIDLPRYMVYYSKTTSVTDVFNSITSWKGDYFFFLLMPLAHFFDLSPSEYISFQTTLGITLLFFAYYRFFYESKSLVFLALFFVVNSSNFYLINGNVLRQGFASSLLLLALTTKTNRRHFIYKILALFTHKGTLPSLFSPLITSRKNILFILLFFSLIIGFFGLHFKVLSYLPIPEFYERKVQFYSSFERASSNSIVKLILLLIFNILFIKYLKMNLELKYKRAFILFYIFSILAVLMIRLDGAFSRFILFSDIFVPILSVQIIKQIKNKKYKSLALFSAIFLSFIYSIYVFNHSSVLFNLGKYLRI